MKNWNIIDLFKSIRNQKEQEEKEKPVYSGVTQNKLIFIDNQWVMYNYPLVDSDTNSDILCIGIMKRWINPKDPKHIELLIVGVSDIGDPIICLLENIQFCSMLIIPQNDNYRLTNYEPDDLDEFLELLELLHIKAEQYWKLYPGLKPEIVDTHGKMKPMMPDDDDDSDRLEEIKSQLNQRKQCFSARIVNPETMETKEINYIVSRDFFERF